MNSKTNKEIDIIFTRINDQNNRQVILKIIAIVVSTYLSLQLLIPALKTPIQYTDWIEIFKSWFLIILIFAIIPFCVLYYVIYNSALLSSSALYSFSKKDIIDLDTNNSMDHEIIYYHILIVHELDDLLTIPPPHKTLIKKSNFIRNKISILLDSTRKYAGIFPDFMYACNLYKNLINYASAIEHILVTFDENWTTAEKKHLHDFLAKNVVSFYMGSDFDFTNFSLLKLKTPTLPIKTRAKTIFSWTKSVFLYLAATFLLYILIWVFYGAICSINYFDYCTSQPEPQLTVGAILFSIIAPLSAGDIHKKLLRYFNGGKDFV